MCTECLDATYTMARSHGLSRDAAFALAKMFDNGISAKRTTTTNSSAYSSGRSTRCSSPETDIYQDYGAYSTYTAAPGGGPTSSNGYRDYDVPLYSAGGSRPQYYEYPYTYGTAPSSAYSSYSTNMPKYTTTEHYPGCGDAYEQEREYSRSRPSARSSSKSSNPKSSKYSSSSSSSKSSHSKSHSSKSSSFSEPKIKKENFYKTLSVSKSATQEEIKKAYRNLSLKNHPDRASAADKQAATEKMADINHAYDVLGDPEKRVLYDRGVY